MIRFIFDPTIRFNVPPFVSFTNYSPLCMTSCLSDTLNGAAGLMITLHCQPVHCDISFGCFQAQGLMLFYIDTKIYHQVNQETA